MTKPRHQPPRVGIHDYQEEISVNGRVMTVGDWWSEFLISDFTILPNALFRTSLGLDAHAKLVLLHLMSWMLKSDPHRPLRQTRGYISQPDLATWCGLSRSSVRRAIDTLCERRYLTTEQRKKGEPLTYRIEVFRLIEDLAEVLPYSI